MLGIRIRRQTVQTGIPVRMMVGKLHAGEHIGEPQSAAAETARDPHPPLVGHLDSAVFPGQTFAVRLPTNLIPQFQTVSGRYFLLRCGRPVEMPGEVDWTNYLRHPLFVCGRQAVDQDERWLFHQPVSRTDSGRYLGTGPPVGQYAADAGTAWLAERDYGDPLDLLGPFGNGFSLLPEMHNLLILADIEDDPAWFWKLLPLCDQALDRGGRVTFLIKAVKEETVADLVSFLPVQVEVRATVGAGQWQELVGSTVKWADQVCAGVPSEAYSELLSLVRSARFRVDKNFAQVLVNADLLCGVGACLVCAVPTARGGLTRSCVHGPVFDLKELAG